MTKSTREDIKVWAGSLLGAFLLSLLAYVFIVLVMAVGA